MKIQHVFATTLSLALVACQVAAPLNIEVNKNTSGQAIQPLTIDKPTLPAIETIATVTQTGDKEQLKVQINLPKALQSGFRTQLAVRDQLAFIKVSLKGQGISGTITHDGAAFLPVTGDTITASISDLPLKNGDLRVVMVQGYDADLNPLGSYEARGYYRSQTGVKTITITLRRSLILLGRILELALSNPALLNALDIPALQTVLEEAMGYNPQTGEFNLDPSQFDADEILALIPAGASPLPTAGDLQTNARQTHQDVLVTVNTPNGYLTNEVVRLVLNDPDSGAKIWPSRTASGSVVSFANVVVGTWILSAYDSDGNLLASTTVNVSEGGVAVTDNPLVLNGVSEYNPEFRLNSYTISSQRNPSIDMDSDGDYVVSWESFDQDGNGYGIFAQRYNSTGATQGSEFRVNTYTIGYQTIPAIAMDSDGDFVVSWTSNGQDGSYAGVYAQRYNSTGSTQGSEFRVNTYTVGDQTVQAIAMDNDGDFVITWFSSNQDGSSGGIYAQRYNSAGTVLGSEFRVNNYTDGSQTLPAIAMDSDGDFVITWLSLGQDGSSGGIYAQRYNSAGTAQDSEFQVNTYTNGSQTAPAIAMDNDRDFVVSWTSNGQDGSFDGIYAQRYNSAGTVLGSEFRVNNYTTNYQSASSIAIDSDGDFVITWESFYQDGSSNGVYARAYHSSGVALNSSEFQVNDYTDSAQAISAIAMDSNGDFVITWQSSGQDASLYGVYATRYNAAGVAQ